MKLNLPPGEYKRMPRHDHKLIFRFDQRVERFSLFFYYIFITIEIMGGL